LMTGNADRFIRFHWEVHKPTEWMLLAHGGSFRRWVGNEQSVLRWSSGWRDVVRRHGNHLP